MDYIECECSSRFVKHGMNFICNRCGKSIEEREADRERQALK